MRVVCSNIEAHYEKAGIVEYQISYQMKNKKKRKKAEKSSSSTFMHN
jgi:hypothetical protein